MVLLLAMLVKLTEEVVEGFKAEIHPKSNNEEPRLVFELEYLESLPKYEMLSLTRYWYKDTLLGRIFRNE